MAAKSKNTTTTQIKEDVDDFGRWLKANHGAYLSLRDAAIPIISNLIRNRGIDVLAISGRLKDYDSAIEKVRRKDYDDPKSQMTDIVGIRIIVYFEHDVKRVSDIIRESFNVDEVNSSNTDERMLPNQVGYRSVHFVCDLGEDRTRLPEFQMLKGLKFEFQVRTVLQHAWAELAHDNNYKFSGSLPRQLERHLFLLAGLLETADQGFSDLSAKIDVYRNEVSQDSAKGALDIPVDSLSLGTFLTQWAKENDYAFREGDRETIPAKLIKELSEFGVDTLAELKKIIPADFDKYIKALPTAIGMISMVRMCMIIHDAKKVASEVKHKWRVTPQLRDFLLNYFSKDEVNEIKNIIESSNTEEQE